MKKTLVALAAVVVSSAAFAQVTITGEMEGGYIATSNAFDNSGKMIGDRSGFGVKKAKIAISDVEDLGNGMKLDARLGLNGLDRSGSSDTNGYNRGADANMGNSTGGDSWVKLMTPAGTVSLKSIAGTSYLSNDEGQSISGVAGYDFQGNDSSYLYGKTPAKTNVGYSVDVGPVNVNIEHDQMAATPIGTGSAGNTFAQSQNTYSLTYKNAGFAINGGYRTYDSQNSRSDTPGVLGFMPSKKSQWRASTAYDFGVATIAGGVTDISYVNGRPNDFTWLLGAAVPVGPVTLGAVVTKINSASLNAMVPIGSSPSSTPTGNQVGVAYTAKYALSKQTSLKAAYARWQQTNITSYNTTEVSVLLSHAF
jgi:Gram-negative porin